MIEYHQLGRGHHSLVYEGHQSREQLLTWWVWLEWKFSCHWWSNGEDCLGWVAQIEDLSLQILQLQTWVIWLNWSGHYQFKLCNWFDFNHQTRETEWDQFCFVSQVSYVVLSVLIAHSLESPPDIMICISEAISLIYKDHNWHSLGWFLGIQLLFVTIGVHLLFVGVFPVVSLPVFTFHLGVIMRWFTFTWSVYITSKTIHIYT